MSVTVKNTIHNEDIDKYLDIWKNFWSVRNTPWHLENRHPALVKYDHMLIGPENNCKKRILFPLCGRNVDMKWYWEQGHEVIGVECADEAIDDFFTLNNIPHTSSDSVPSIDGKIFKTQNEKLKIIQANFLTLDSPLLNNTIEAVWDRGSLVAISYEEQVLYAQTMKRLLAPEFRYLLSVFQYDESMSNGPPYSISEERINHLMGEFCNIEKIESTVLENFKLPQSFTDNPPEVRESIYLLTRKMNQNQ